MKREIVRPFDRGPFIWRDAQGDDQIVSECKPDLVPAVDAGGDPIPTVRQIVETTAAVFDLIAADPDIIVGGEVS